MMSANRKTGQTISPFRYQHFNRFAAGLGVGGDFEVVLADVAAPLYQCEHVTLSVQLLHFRFSNPAMTATMKTIRIEDNQIQLRWEDCSN